MKRSKRLNKYSLSRITKLNGEKEARIALCKRAGGTPVLQNEMGKRNDGEPYMIERVLCVGGKCECGCGERADVLEPHERLLRSRGGKVSLHNSIMVKRKHHPDYRKVKLQWIKGI